MYDVAIIGLGPAGSTIARLLNKKFKVIAIDKKLTSGEGGFQKPCGGLLAPDAQKSFIKFNLNLPTDVLSDPQIFSVKTIDIKTRFIRNYQRTYINFNRHKFDLWLKSLIPENIDVKNNAIFKRIEKLPENKGYSVIYTQNGNEVSVNARFIIGADGANSHIRSYIYKDEKIKKYMSIQQWYKENNSSSFYSCIFDPDITDCCAWSISKDDYFILGGAFKINDSRKKFEILKEKLEDFDFKFGTPLKTEACLVLRPSRITDFYCGKDNIFLIGEAAGFISASSFEGISYAFESALELSKILNSGAQNPNNLYKRKTFKIRLKLITKIIKAGILYSPFLRNLILKSGIKDITILEKNN